MGKKRSLYADSSRSKGCRTVINEMKLLAALLRYEDDLNNKKSHTGCKVVFFISLTLFLSDAVAPGWAHQPLKTLVNPNIVNSSHTKC